MKILFLCVANSARSQIAEGIARELWGSKVNVLSAGSQPSAIHPLAIQVMTEIGIDISHQRSKSIDSIQLDDLTHIITLCDQEICPYIPSKAVYEHWSIEDPAKPGADQKEQIEKFRNVRDYLKERILEFMNKLPLSE